MRNTRFMARMIYERVIEKQRDVYMCFIDYTKAFDRVQYDELLKMLMNLDPEPILGPITLYRNRKSDKSIYQNQGGVHQGSVLSPDLFNLYSKMIL